jgi:MSHA biogenesis protein MshI
MSQQINLYNAAFVPKRELVTAKNLAVATGVLLVSLIAFGSGAALQAQQKAVVAAAAQTQLKQTQEAMEAARVASGARKPSAALQAELDQTRRLLAMREEVLAILSQGMGEGKGNGGAGFGDYLAGLARQTRDGLWLSGFSISAGGHGMSLSGRTLDKATLPDYVRRLNNEPAFAGKAFAGLQMDYRELIRPADTKNSAAPPAPTFPAKVEAPARFIEFMLVAENTVATETKR